MSTGRVSNKCSCEGVADSVVNSIEENIIDVFTEARKFRVMGEHSKANKRCLKVIEMYTKNPGESTYCYFQIASRMMSEAHTHGFCVDKNLLTALKYAVGGKNHTYIIECVYNIGELKPSLLTDSTFLKYIIDLGGWDALFDTPMEYPPWLVLLKDTFV